MRCEVVAIGTELLLGQIIDSNSSWIGEQLAQAGIDSLYQTKVGDNHGRIVATLRQALERSDAAGFDLRTLLVGEGTAQGLLTRRDDPRSQAEVPWVRCASPCPLEALALETRDDLGLLDVREERCAAL